jgi:hypothetical protein
MLVIADYFSIRSNQELLEGDQNVGPYGDGFSLVDIS